MKRRREEEKGEDRSSLNKKGGDTQKRQDSVSAIGGTTLAMAPRPHTQEERQKAAKRTSRQADKRENRQTDKRETDKQTNGRPVWRSG